MSNKKRTDSPAPATAATAAEPEPSFHAPSSLPLPPAPPIGAPVETYVVQSLDRAKQPLAEMEVQADSHMVAMRCARKAMPTHTDETGTRHFRVCRISDGRVCDTSYAGG